MLTRQSTFLIKICQYPAKTGKHQFLIIETLMKGIILLIYIGVVKFFILPINIIAKSSIIIVISDNKYRAIYFQAQYIFFIK